MKVRITVPVFKNKETGIYHQQGDVIDVSKQRFEEITAKGPIIKPIRAPRSAKPKPESIEITEESEEAPADEPEPDPEPLHSVEGIPYIEDIRRK